MILALLRDLMTFAGPRAALRTAFLMLLAGLLEGVGLALFVPLLGILTQQGDGRFQHVADRVFGAAHASTPIEKLALMLLAFVALSILRASAVLRRDRRIQAMQIGFVQHLRMRLIRALGEAAWSDVARLRHARALNALTTDVQRVSNALLLALQAGVASVMLFAQFTVAVLLAPLIAVLALSLLLAGAWTMRPMLRRSKALGDQLGRSGLAIVDAAAQLMSGLKIASAQNMQHHFLACYEASVTAMADRQIAYHRRDGAARAILSAGGATAGAAILFVGYWIQGPTASLAAALLAIARMGGPGMLIQQNAQLLAVLAPAHASIAALVDELTSRRARPSSACGALEGPIQLRGVSYAHDAHRAVADLDFSIARGAIIGIVGPSGAGKTTVIDLIAGLLVPDRGQIVIGPTPLDDVSLPLWRNRIAYVGQDPWLINDTVRRNLEWGNADLDEEALWSTLTLMEAEAMVRGLPDGLDTEVAERGIRLSGGERQRIALARAVLRRPELLILDEATNAIDIAAERRILTRLAAAFPRPTILIVAHRAESVELCERVLTFRGGRLVADEAR